MLGQTPHHQVMITESARRKLLAAYAHVDAVDDEYAVPAVVIAESNIFVDVALLSEAEQMRSRFNVVASGPGTRDALEQLQDRYKGKIRLSVTHCHQFGSPGLSSTDQGGFRSILHNPNSSKPYADGSRIPVLLINGSGRSREILAFMVTPTECHRTELLTISDDDFRIRKALKAAPVALPTLRRQDVLDRIERDTGPEWQVRLARSKTKGIMALLLSNNTGQSFVIELGPEWPGGKPRFLIRAEGDLVASERLYGCLDLNGLVRGLKEYEHNTMGIPEGIQMGFTGGKKDLPKVTLLYQSGEAVALPDDFPWIEHLNWADFSESQSSQLPPIKEEEDDFHLGCTT
jgi:hypothetical protein